jgi:hypothetical protein
MWQPEQSIAGPPHCGVPAPWQLTLPQVFDVALYVAVPVLYAAANSTFRVPFVWLVPAIAVPAAVTYPEWQFAQVVAVL